jgi:UDP-glucose 4-epimerase
MKRLLEDKRDESVEVFNLGTGRGLSVLEIIDIFQKVNGVEVLHKLVGRRDGDIEKVWANPERANKVLGWTAVESIEETLHSAWVWKKRLAAERNK